MDHFDIDRSLRSMVVLVDTREQDTPRFRKRLEGLKCPFERATLSYGDYSAKCTLPSGEEFSLADKLVIERKMNATEICGNFTKGRRTFTDEFERAKAAGGKLILMVECSSWDAAYRGQYRSKLNPKSLVASLFTFEHRYDAHIHYVPSELSGQWIYDCLYYALRERLRELGEAA